MKDSYNYVFHYNDYVSGPDKWHCFHRDDFSSYWGGPVGRTGEGRPVSFTTGTTPADAWQKMNKLDEQIA